MAAAPLASAARFLRRHAVPLALLGVALAAYGLTAPWQGLYWDDWGVAYITRFVGPRGFFDWNAVSRPARAPFDLLFSWLLGANPFAWQIAGLLLRWALALAGFHLFKRLWPGREQAAFVAACVLLVYPGLSEQYLPLTFAYFWLVGILFCLSLLLTWRAVRGGRVSWPLLILSALLAGFQQFMLEYLFGLEVLRFLLLWRETRGQPRRLWRFFLLALPFLAALSAYLFWRVLIFDYGHYRVTSIAGLARQPAQAAADLLSFAVAGGAGAWARAFTFPFLSGMPAGQRWVLAGVMALTLFGLAAFLRRCSEEESPRRQAFLWIGLGLLALFAAGLPALAGGQSVRLAFPEDRLTFPFMFGSALVAAGLLSLIADRSSRTLAMSVLIAAAVGLQFQYGCYFLEQKQLQRDFLWQLVWRAPGLQPRTALLTDDVATFPVDDDEALSYLINWAYAPDQRGGDLPYVLFMLSANFESPEEFAALPSLRQDFFEAAYEGDPRDALVIRFAPPSCLRVLDPRYDAGLIQVALDADQPWRREATAARALPYWTSAALAWSDPARILPAPATPARPPAEYLGAEPEHGWCYYFQRADLARQQGDWARAAALGDQAFSAPYLPADYSELLLFVEAYARTGRRGQAQALALWGLERAPALQPAVCDILQRLAGGSERDQAQARSFSAQVGCP